MEVGRARDVLRFVLAGGRRTGATENKLVFAVGNWALSGSSPPSDLPDTDRTRRIGIRNAAGSGSGNFWPSV